MIKIPPSVTAAAATPPSAGRAGDSPVESRIASGEIQYVGFLPRLGAAILDGILICLVVIPLQVLVYGSDVAFADDSKGLLGPADFVLSYIFPFVATVLFWLYLRATPGKLAVSARVVDATSGDTISPKQAVIRYVGYYVSSIVLCLGFLWILFDPRKQGWHDKMAGTVVIREK